MDAVELVLYVTRDSRACDRAQAALQRLLERYDPAGIDLRICDVTLDPSIADRDGVIVTPTLIKRAPAPPVWILGDLSRADVVTEMLESCGVRPKPADAPGS